MQNGKKSNGAAPTGERSSADQAESGMVNLTGRQLKFVEGVLAGKSSVDAYRAAYDCTGYSSDNAIYVSASRLRNSPKVSLVLAETRRDALRLTYDQHDKNLERLRVVAEATGNIGAAVQAEQLRGRAAGLYTERVEDVTAHNPLKTLERIAAISPGFAKELARQHGIAWEPMQDAEPEAENVNDSTMH